MGFWGWVWWGRSRSQQAKTNRYPSFTAKRPRRFLEVSSPPTQRLGTSVSSRSRSHMADADARLASVLRLLLNEYDIFDVESLTKYGWHSRRHAGRLVAKRRRQSEGCRVWWRSGGKLDGRRGHADDGEHDRGEHGYGWHRQTIRKLHGQANGGLPWCADGAMLVRREHGFADRC